MEYEIKKYPDGSSYVVFNGVKYSGTGPEHITYRINSYEDLWHLGQLLDVLTYNSVEAIVTIPNLFDGQADRRFEVNHSSGLALILDFLNKISSGGDTHGFYIFHPHNPEVVENVLQHYSVIDNEGFIREVLTDLVALRDYDSIALEENTILMSSDAGGFKPLMKLADQLEWDGETYSASKSRKWVDGQSKLIQIIEREDFGGKDILIVDDICVYGGTFKGLAKMLREKNVGKLYLAVSHLTIQNHKGDDPVFKYFDKVFTTNSKYDNYWVETFGGQPAQPQNLQIIKLFDV